MAQAKQSYSRSTTIGNLYAGDNAASIKIQTKGKPKKTIQPVIYVPGIFASRIQDAKTGKTLWDPDDFKSMKKSLINGLLGSIIGSNVTWTDEDIDKKTEILHAEGKILDKHHDKIIAPVIKRIKQGKPYRRLLELVKIDPWVVDGTFDDEPTDKEAKRIKSLAEEEYARRQSRGWYEILDRYADIMEHIYMLNHNDFLFPTYGFGFDWRSDMTGEAERFVKRIDQILAQTKYQEFGQEKQDYLIDPAQKVIIVTHSMGSIMSRYASEVLGASNKIHSMVHLNQPTTGAPVLYRRFLGGTGAEKRFPFSIDAIGDNVFNEILGNNSYHFTRVGGGLAGAIQLLPTNDHLAAETVDKKWLQLKDKRLSSRVSETDIYKLYKDKTVGLISCKRYDKSGNPKPYTKEEFQRITLSHSWDVENFTDEYVRDVTPKEIKSFDKAEYYYRDTTSYTKDNYRLRPEPSPIRQVISADEPYSILEENIDGASTFHTKLRLKHHKETWVVASEGKDTFNFVELNLNSENVLNISYKANLRKQGDGTVPLTSQDALLRNAAKRAGPVVTPNTQNTSTHETIGITDVTHASMPSNRNAIAQVLEKIEVITQSIKPVKVNTP